MKNNNSTKKNIIIAIENIKNNYNKYNKYLTDKYYNNLTNEFFKYDFSNIGVVSDISMIIENKVQADLCKIANVELDVMVLLIDKYVPIVRIILKKTNPELIKNKILMEDIVIESISTYDGSNLFSLHVLDLIKEKNKVKKI